MVLKVELTCHFARLEGVWRGEGITLLVLNLDTRLMCVVSFTPRPVYPRAKNLSFPLTFLSTEWEFGGAPPPVWALW